MKRTVLTMLALFLILMGAGAQEKKVAKVTVIASTGKESCKGYGYRYGCRSLPNLRFAGFR